MARKKSGKYMKCLNCGDPVYVYPKYIGKRNFFCKQKCYFEFIKKRRENGLRGQE